jgi:dihydropteroate synthase
MRIQSNWPVGGRSARANWRMPASIARRPRSLRLRDGRVIRFPAVMGILNVTPDSFSDGGRFLDPEKAVDQALAMQAAGAAIIDIGGESTRPGAAMVGVEFEMDRVLPVIEALRSKLKVPISIDTRKAVVASAALDEGAAIVNDVSGLTFDPIMMRSVAQAGAALILMHTLGTPETMNRQARYKDVVAEVNAFLERQAEAAVAAGVPRARIIVDPGLGFAKNARHNLKLMGGLSEICALGYPVLVGASRKRFVRAIAGGTESDLLFGNVAANALAVAAGASIVRVHDPGPTAAAVKMAVAIAEYDRGWRKK